MKSDWLIAYDIADHKRWRQVFSLLKSYGFSVQLSLFFCQLSGSQRRKLEQDLSKVMSAQEDRVHFFPLCGQCASRVVAMGNGEGLPVLEDVWFVGDA